MDAGMPIAMASARRPMSTSNSIHWALPRRELLELLETTRAEDAPPGRLRVPADRRTQTPSSSERPPKP